MKGLQDEVIDLNDKIELIKFENDEYKQQTTEQDENVKKLEDDNNNANSEYSQLMENYERAEQIILSLKKDLRENESKITQYSDALKINNEKVHTLTSDIFGLRDNCSNLRQQLIDSETTKNKLQTE